MEIVCWLREKESGPVEGEGWKSGIKMEREQIYEQRRGRDCENYQTIPSVCNYQTTHATSAVVQRGV